MVNMKPPAECPRCAEGDYTNDWRPDGLKHVITTAPPDDETVGRWIMEREDCEATDGCRVEPDGMCEHGHRSWLRVLGII
jgi:hypothetical protein